MDTAREACLSIVKISTLWRNRQKAMARNLGSTSVFFVRHGQSPELSVYVQLVERWRTTAARRIHLLFEERRRWMVSAVNCICWTEWQDPTVRCSKQSGTTIHAGLGLDKNVRESCFVSDTTLRDGIKYWMRASNASFKAHVGEELLASLVFFRYQEYDFGH